jgi:hypothetical protein
MKWTYATGAAHFVKNAIFHLRTDALGKNPESLFPQNKNPAYHCRNCKK